MFIIHKPEINKSLYTISNDKLIYYKHDIKIKSYCKYYEILGPT